MDRVLKVTDENGTWTVARRDSRELSWYKSIGWKIEECVLFTAEEWEEKVEETKRRHYNP